MVPPKIRRTSIASSGGGGSVATAAKLARVTMQPDPPAMASPPTIAPVSLNVSGIASAVSWYATDQISTTDQAAMFAHYTPLFGRNWKQYGSTFPNYLTATCETVYDPVNAPAGNNNFASFTALEMTHYGTEIEFVMKDSTGTLKLYVDNAPVGAGATWTISNTGGFAYCKATFAAAAARLIRVEVDVQNFAWVNTGPNDALYAAYTGRPKCVVLGDSFTEGTTLGTSACDGYVRVLGRRMGWTTLNSGQGGTGYLNPGSGGRVNFRTRVASDVIAEDPDIVIVAGGINDYGSYSAAAIGAEAALLFAQIRAGLPNALLAVVSPFWRNGVETFPSNLLETRDAIKAAALAAGAKWIDVLEMPLRTGAAASTTLAAGAAGGATTLSLTAPLPPSGTVEIVTGATKQRRVITAISGGGPYSATVAGLSSAVNSGDTVTLVGPCLWTGTGDADTAGTGNSPVLVNTDGTHPTVAGHAAIAAAIGAQLVAAFN